MVSTLSPGEEAQLTQTIEMFEVITQSQPNDYQSLEILKEAYSKLNREQDVINTSKRIAQAYVQMGQLSSAILEYETISQRFPDDPDVQAALKQIESQANNFSDHPTLNEPAAITKSAREAAKDKKVAAKTGTAEVDDGRDAMFRIFVDSKIITSGDFDLCWTKPDLSTPPEAVTDPFVQVLSDKAILP
ncbi:MAG TPA: tetratricopeptide repeat protein, partial [Verrucomicrobiae bacterium]|nr:tetratricopeptide repeat protein [Verrucomicrobiae bacterium]